MPVCLGARCLSHEYYFQQGTVPVQWMKLSQKFTDSEENFQVRCLTPSMNKINHKKHFTWFGSRFWEAEHLLSWFKISFSITLEASSGVIPGISLENILRRRLLWGSQHLYNSKLWQNISTLPEDIVKNTYLLSYVPFPASRTSPLKPIWTIPPSLLHLWNDKIRTRKWLVANGFPTLSFIDIRKGNWPSISKSTLMVLQARDGSCGTKTYIGKSSKLQEIFLQSGWISALLSPFIDGWIINGHILIYGNGLVEIPWPSIQYVIPILKNGYIRPIYAGNDFLAFQRLIPLKIRLYIRQILQQLGELVARKGYKGIMGADILYNPRDHSINILEINPRIQGSTGLLSLLELNAGFKPAIARMFLSLLGYKMSSVDYSDQIPCGQGLFVSQYLLREGIQDKISFDRKFIFRYGKRSGFVKQNLVIRERILTDYSILSSLPEYNYKFI